MYVIVIYKTKHECAPVYKVIGPYTTLGIATKVATQYPLTAGLADGKAVIQPLVRV